LSTTQAAYESSYLSRKLAYYDSGYLPPTGVASAGSGYYFYDILSSISKSPSAGAQRATSPLPANLSRTLALPPSKTGNWFFADGGFYNAGYPTTYEVSYSGGEVINTLLTPDGTHRLASSALTQVAVTSLAGPIVSDAGKAMGLLPGAVYTNPALTNSGAVWGSGSAYSTLTRRYTTDWYLVDSLGSPFKSGTTINNLIADNLLLYAGKLYGANDGSVSVVQGV